MATLVRLVPCVRPDVLLKVGELGELALADLATVRLDPEVDSRVLRKVGAVGEGLSTSSTFVGFWLSQVDLGVQLQVGLAVESLENADLGENGRKCEEMEKWEEKCDKSLGQMMTDEAAGLRGSSADLRTHPALPAFVLLQ